MDDSSSLPSNPNILTNNCKRKTTISSSSYDQISSPNITFVQADPSNFRAVVQKLTGADQKPHLPSRYTGKPTSGEMGTRELSFKLHQRRQNARKNLEIKLHNGVISLPGFTGEMVMGSPVSPLEILGIRSLPRTPRSPSEEEESAIAGKGFYLHRSPVSIQRGAEPPELLPLFPLSSPRHDSPTSS